MRACLSCGGELHLIGDTVGEMLDHVPARLRVIRIRRPRYLRPNMLQMVVVEFFRTFWTAAFSLLGFTLHWTHAPR